MEKRKCYCLVLLRNVRRKNILFALITYLAPAYRPCHPNSFTIHCALGTTPRLGGIVWVEIFVFITSNGVINPDAIAPARAPDKKNTGEVPPPTWM